MNLCVNASYGITRLDIDVLKEIFLQLYNPRWIIKRSRCPRVNHLCCCPCSWRVSNKTHSDRCLWRMGPWNFCLNEFYQSRINWGIRKPSSKSNFLPSNWKNRRNKDKAIKLNAMIKPFILKKAKITSPPTDLPEKIIQIVVCQVFWQRPAAQEEGLREWRTIIREKNHLRYTIYWNGIISSLRYFEAWTQLRK